MTKEKSLFETNLRALITAEKERRNGNFTAKEFCESVGLKPQAISSMRKGMSMEALGKTLKKYPHWNPLFLVAGEGDPIPAVSPVPAISESTKKTETVNEWLQEENFKLKSELAKLKDEGERLRKENEILNVKVVGLTERLADREQEQRGVTPGVVKRGSRTA